MFTELGEYFPNMLSEAFWTLNIALLQFDRYPKLGLQSKSFPVKDQLCLMNIPNYVREANVYLIKNGL